MRGLAAVVGVVVLAGCATREIPSKLFDMQNGQVLSASFLWKGDLTGPATIFRPSEACTGQYSTIVQGRTSYGVGTAAGAWGGLFSTLYSSSSVERAQKGMAVAICPSGITFECEYITNVGFTGVSGHGACKDNRGTAYRLMF